ncbi:TIM barrel protein [Carboxylicivirga sp. M1479]|nr:TIM barrel protein [Carboxylicivirga sp. M1479]
MRFALVLGILLVSMPTINIRAQEVKKNIGIQLWSVRDNMKTDADGTIKQLGNMGYTFIEAAGYADGKFYGMEPQDFKKLLNANGLQFTASHCGKALPEKEDWDTVMAWWDECIEAHAKAGVTYLVQPFMDKKGYGSLADLKRYCDYFNQVGDKCNAKGIRFGYHNHDKEFGEVDGHIRYDYMLKNTDPEKVMFQLDLYWIMVGGKEAAQYFENYPGRFELWHVKDEKELGESGKMDFESVFKLKKKAGMKEIIVEVERYSYEPLVSVKKSLEFLIEASYVN